MLILTGTLALIASVQNPAGASAIVAADGSAQYRTVQEAINAAPQDTSPDRRWVIFIKTGTYHELLYVQREKHFVMLVGEDPLKTIITYGLKAGDTGPDGTPIGTFRTSTAVIDADDFSAENLTFENAAGPNGQALAIRVDGDRVVFRNCRFLGWQDTVFVDRGRQYFEDSVITGHVDFIFGGATAFFERCRVHAVGNGYLTAASTPQEAVHGLVFAHGSITGEPGVKTYLGRPWRAYSAVAFVQTEMSDTVRPEGWHNWDHPEREQTTRYAEFGTTGPGASANRVKWAHALAAAAAAKLTVDAVLGGVDKWDPRRVPTHPSAVRALDGPPRPPGPHLHPPI
jgi:pectinesterase